MDYVAAELPVLSKLIQNYHNNYLMYGDSALGVSWQEKDQKILFEIAKKELVGTTLLDYGCGLGHFYEFLGDKSVKYLGIDLNPIFAQRCMEKGINAYYGSIEWADVFLRMPCFDTIVALGTFHYRNGEVEDIEKKVDFMSRTLWKLANKKFIFTLITKKIYDFFTFTPKKIERLFKDFDVREVRKIKVGEMVVFILER